MVIAGIGQAGKEIAKLFKPHTKNYTILIYDENDGLESKKTPEEYDSIDIKIDPKTLKKQDKGILFVCGSGKVAGVTLRVLEALSSLKMTVVYLVPDLEFSSREERTRHKIHFNVLQEFTRSGKIAEMIILSNTVLLEIAGKGPISRYYEKVNYFIYSTFQNLNYCQNVSQNFGNLHEPKNISRISTIGFSNFNKNEEKLFFPLDNITESCYIINIDEEDLNNDEEILPKSQKIVRDNKAKGRETSFAIWESSEENSYYVKHYTHHIQEIK